MPLFPHNSTEEDLNPNIRRIVEMAKGFEDEKGIDLRIESEAQPARHNSTRCSQVATSIDGEWHLLVLENYQGLRTWLAPVGEVQLSDKETLDKEDLVRGHNSWGHFLFNSALVLAALSQLMKKETPAEAPGRNHHDVNAVWESDTRMDKPQKLGR